MVYVRLVPVLTLLFGLHGWPASRPPRPPLAAMTVTAVKQPAQPAGASTVYMPMMFNRFASNYTSPFGIVMYNAIDNAHGQAKLLAAGAHWFTTDLLWAAVEPNPPVGNVHTYDWWSLDQDAINAQTAGAEIYVLINRNPTWASAYPSGPVTNTQNLVDFAAAAAERYDGDGFNDAPGSPVINYWSYYAEPDNGAEWAALAGKGYFGHNPTGYANMLMAVSPAVHAANPHAKVLIGGLAYDSFESQGGPFVESFFANVLTALGNANAANYIDAIAFHYYPINAQRFPSIYEKGVEIRNIMNAHGVGQLELIVPEMGYWSDPANGSSELTQARVLVQMYVKGLSLNISHLDWFQTFDGGTGMESHGLFNNGNLNQPKQAYTAYGTLTNALYALRYNRPANISGGEGYVFRGPDGRETTVAWATTSSATAHFAGSCVRKTDLLGATSTIVDGSGSDQNAAGGVVGVALTQNHPIYLTPCN